VIEVDHLIKRFGAVTAVDGLTFSVRPGHVTGFLGPNGAGKTTTMRVILGLDAWSLVVLLAWPAVALLAAAVTITRRDA
jgi:ABC-type uncharacterized transport system ATPase subunit